MTNWYKKELEDSPVWVAGHPLTFDVLETSDPLLIQELDKCVTRGVGGVLSISAETYAEEVKKKEREKLSGNNSKPQYKRTELSFIGSPGAAGVSSFTRRQQPEAPQQAPSNVPMPDPIEVPGASSFALPPTAKMKDLKASKK